MRCSRYEIVSGPTELADTGGLLSAVVRTFEDDAIILDANERRTLAEVTLERRLTNQLKDSLSATLGQCPFGILMASPCFIGFILCSWYDDVLGTT